MSSAASWQGIDWDGHVHEVRIDGRRLRYVDFGEGPPLLLVHGMAGSWQSWLANIAELGERHRVIAVDLPGFGGSDPLPLGATFSGYVDALEALLDHLRIPSVAVVGHSLGGLVALTVAVDRPARVRCIVLVSGGGGALSRVRLALIQAVFSLFRVVLVVPGVRSLLTTRRASRLILRPAVHRADSIPSELVQQMLPRSIGPGFMAAVRLGSAHLSDLDVGRIGAPVLLVWGREDLILPLRTARQLASELNQAQLVVLDEVGHCAMFEAAGEFNALVQNFLDMQVSDRKGPAAGRATARSWMTPRSGGNDTERYSDGIVG